MVPVKIIFCGLLLCLPKTYAQVPNPVNVIEQSSSLMLQKKYGEAEELLTQCLHQYQNKDDSLYFGLISSLALIQSFMGKTESALQYYAEVIDLTTRETERKFAVLSEKEREVFWETISRMSHVIHSFTAKYHKEEPASAALSYNCELLTKNRLLNTSKQIFQSVLNDRNITLEDLWKKLAAYKQELLEAGNLIREMEHILIPKSFSLEEMEEYAAMKKDGEMTELLSNLRQDKQQYAARESDFLETERYIMSTFIQYSGKTSLSFRWEDVRQTMQAGDAAIEFAQVEKIDFPELKVDSACYYAFVVRPGYLYPEMIYLCTEEALETALQQSTYPSEELYRLVWKPLEKQLQNARKIYLAPSGSLCKISFTGIKNGDKYLCDDYEIHHLLSTKDIINLKIRPYTISAKAGTAALFGGADFALAAAESPQAGKHRGQGFGYLPGSAHEVKHIKKQLDSLHWKTRLFIDKEATKTNFKSLSSTQSPELLHISTHGFYFPENTHRVVTHPLMRCGLAFSGANRAWSGKKTEIDDDDGILTAYEISNMNLAGTQLVVLSACETGLGDIAGGEGVYGLQRAFRLAGASSLIVSLHDVPDRETAELMTAFYSHWNNETGLYKAFSAAQQQLRRKYPGAPEKWAGFILYE
jgi:CHAT domain-containing protein